MSRRRAAKKKNSSSSALVLTVGAAVFVLAVIVGIVMFRAGEKPQAGSDIPLDILAANASQLSNNNYALDGTVTDRFPDRQRIPPKLSEMTQSISIKEAMDTLDGKLVIGGVPKPDNKDDPDSDQTEKSKPKLKL